MKWKPKGKIVAILITLVVVAILAGCEGASTKSDTTNEETREEAASVTTNGPKSVSVGITRTPVSFNPLDRADWSQFYISSILFNPLVEMNDQFEFIPMLAESIETEDNQSFIVHLNPTAKWTDGIPVTADDVLFSLEMITHEKFSSLLTSQFQILDGLESNGKLISGTMAAFPGAQKIDDHTIEFRTQTPVDLNVFKEKIAANLKAIPKHILGDVDPETLQQHPFMQKPTVTNGAFTFVDYQTNQYVELKANEDYFRGEPKLDHLYFKIMTAANLVAQLQNGEIDMNYPEIGSLSIQDYETVKNMNHIKTIDGEPVNYKLMGFNTKSLDQKVRQAIAYGINREMLVNNLLKGAGEVSTGPYAPVHPYYNDKIRDAYPYDPEKAEQLLDEAGWDSSRTIDYIVPIGNQELEQTGDIVTANLKEIGINVQVHQSDIPGMIQRLRSGDFDLYSITFSFVLDPDVSFVYQSEASNNFTYYSNPEVDELLSKGLRETHFEDRKKLYDRFQEIHVEELPEIGLYADYRLRAVNERVIVGEPKDIGMLINVHEWDVQ